MPTELLPTENPQLPYFVYFAYFVGLILPWLAGVEILNGIGLED